MAKIPRRVCASIDLNNGHRPEKCRCLSGEIRILQTGTCLRLFGGIPIRKRISMMENKVTDREICPYYKKCGSCHYQGISYEKELADKQKRLQKLLGVYGKVNPILGMEVPLHYRNKVHAVLGYQKGKVLSGTYSAGSHHLVPVEHCQLDDPAADEIILTIRELVRSFKIRVYDEDSGYGLLRHILIRTAGATGQIMVILVAVSPVFPSKNNFVKALLKKHPEITTVVLNVNSDRTSMVLGDRNIVLYGKGYITDQLLGCSFRLSAAAFYQVNAFQTEKLYAQAIRMAGLTGRETVIDAYSGIGTIGLIAARRAGQVISIESNPVSVKDGIQNAKLNDIKNVRFYRNDATRFMQQMVAAHEKADVVIMDPPRAGSTPEFIRAAAALGPSRIVYVSCNPETLARDLALFKKQGFKVREIQPVDMFSGTAHVETCALLTKASVSEA